MRRIMTLALVLALAGWSCSSGGGGQSSPGPAVRRHRPDSPDPLMDFNGIWKGTSISSMNAASAKITFNVKREGNQIKGNYLMRAGQRDLPQ